MQVLSTYCGTFYHKVVECRPFCQKARRAVFLCIVDQYQTNSGNDGTTTYANIGGKIQTGCGNGGGGISCALLNGSRPRMISSTTKGGAVHERISLLRRRAAAVSVLRRDSNTCCADEQMAKAIRLCCLYDLPAADGDAHAAAARQLCHG